MLAHLMLLSVVMQATKALLYEKKKGPEGPFLVPEFFPSLMRKGVCSMF